MVAEDVFDNPAALHPGNDMLNANPKAGDDLIQKAVGLG